MKWFKRIALFIATNILVMATISVFLNIILPLFGVNLAPNGIGALMVFCGVWGFGGAFVSLLISKLMAKWAYGVQIINPNTTNPAERELLQTVHRMAEAAKLKKMPEVGIYDSPEVNAFATGPSKSNSLVAVSTGLLGRMSKGEVEGVIGHEVAHIANGDMVTMTLIQGVVNSFALFFSRILARVVASAVDEKISTIVYFVATLIFDIAFTILGSMLIAMYSRRREYRADYGGALYAGRDKMIAGLRRLQAMYPEMPKDEGGLAVMKISNKPGGVMALFSTHPRLEDRIERLQNAVIIR